MMATGFAQTTAYLRSAMVIMSPATVPMVSAGLVPMARIALTINVNQPTARQAGNVASGGNANQAEGGLEAALT